MKGPTEARVRQALGSIAAESDLTWWKPPDDARNWKPADFLTWFKVPMRESACGGYSAFIEVKDNALVGSFPVKDIRPVQLSYMRQAARMRIPYVLAVWWRKRHRWTVCDAAKIVRWLDEQGEDAPRSIAYELMISRFGVDSTEAMLASMLKAAMYGELG